MDINRIVTTVGGDLLVQSAGNISVDANITATLGEVGLIAVTDVLQQANVTGVNVLVDAGRDIITMAAGSVTLATDFALLNVGRDIGLGLVQAGQRVGLSAVGDILSNNGGGVPTCVG